MSRIGKHPIAVPAGVEVKVDGSTVTVKGPKGTLTKEFKPSMAIAVDGGFVTVTRPDDEKENRARCSYDFDNRCYRYGRCCDRSCTPGQPFKYRRRIQHNADKAVQGR